MIDHKPAVSLFERALAYAKKLGATQAEAAFTLSKGLSVTVRLGDVETVEYNAGRSIGFTLFNGKAKGHASTNDERWEMVQQALDRAWFIAKHTEQDAAAGLPEKELLAFEYPDLNLYHPHVVTTEQAITLAKASEQAAMELDSRIQNSDGAGVDVYEGFQLLMNSEGFCGHYPASRYGLSCSVIAQENDAMEREYEYTVARRFNQLWTPETVGLQAAQKALARLNSQKLKTCKVPVIFNFDVARSVIGHFLTAISGGQLYRRSSFLVDSLGQPIFSEIVTITENPLILEGLSSAPFDDEGVRTCASAILSNGVLDRYLLGTYSARKLGLKTTGNAGGTHNILVNSTGQSFESLLQLMGRGLLVTEVMGPGVNIVTGDYSRGAAGFWVENGQIAYPVSEITISSPLSKMFHGVQAIGTDIDERGGIQVGSILIDEMTVAGA